MEKIPTTDSPDNISDWLADVLPRHQRLTNAVISLLENILREREIEYLSVTGRTKTLKSVLEKIQRKGYGDPKKELTDLSGIRVITYLESQVTDVIKAIRTLFQVDEPNSLDRSSVLGSDRIGYRSAHFVCSLGTKREGLPEYMSITELPFEIQARTVLQHAWAELAHDRSFKFGPGLPTPIQRKLNLYSGMLEVVDGAFDSIAQEIDDYAASLRDKTTRQIADVEISTISLAKFISDTSKKYGIHIEDADISPEVLAELKHFGISTVGQLEALISENLIASHKAAIGNITALGFLRSLMMYNDFSKYLEGPFLWRVMQEGHFKLLASRYSLAKLNEMLASHSITVSPKPTEGVA